MGKRKSMHPTPSEQRPFVYLMKRTTRRTPPSAESRAPFLPSYAPGGSSIPLFPSAATGQALVAKLSNLPTLSYGFPTPAGSLSSSISLNSLESRGEWKFFKITPILSLSRQSKIAPSSFGGKEKKEEENEEREREGRSPSEIRKFVPTEHQDFVAAHEFLVPAEQKRGGVPRDSARENLINENDDSKLCARGSSLSPRNIKTRLGAGSCGERNFGRAAPRRYLSSE